MKKYVLIVDGYSGGSHLPAAFAKEGFSILHLQSEAEVWKKVAPTFDFSVYERNFSLQASSRIDIENQLRAYEVVAVVPGTETGVPAADFFAERLNLRGNGLKKSNARRDKFEMLKACREAGVQVGSFFEARVISDLKAWYDQQHFSRVVLKPLRSAGTDGVRFVSNISELESAFHQIIGTENKLGFINDSVLACEFLEGPEFFLNTVCFDGEALFTDIWRYEKRTINGQQAVYDRNILCPYEGEVQNTLRDYVKKVLKALDIRWGPAHTEVIMTKSGPRLVEIGARLDGLTLPSVNLAATGLTPVEKTVEALTRSCGRIETSYDLKKQAQTVYLTSYQEGRLKSIPGRQFLEGLPSFFQMSLRNNIGGSVKKTTDYFSAPGFLTLLHEDATQLNEDYLKIRQMEKENGIFEIEPE